MKEKDAKVAMLVWDVKQTLRRGGVSEATIAQALRRAYEWGVEDGLKSEKARAESA